MPQTCKISKQGGLIHGRLDAANTGIHVANMLSHVHVDIDTCMYLCFNLSELRELLHLLTIEGMTLVF